MTRDDASRRCNAMQRSVRCVTRTFAVSASMLKSHHPLFIKLKVSYSACGIHQTYSQPCEAGVKSDSTINTTFQSKALLKVYATL